MQFTNLLPAFLPSLPPVRSNILTPHYRTLHATTALRKPAAPIFVATLAPDRPATLASNPRTRPASIPPRAPVPTVHVVPGLSDWRFTGPPLSEGARPAVIYLALTADLSLTLDPFNQFVVSLARLNPHIRIFTPTLPLHTRDMAANDAVFHAWRSVYASGGDVVAPFVRNVTAGIDTLVKEGVIKAGEVHVVGLSRGGLLAGLVAARCGPHVRSVLAFAPVTSLDSLSEFDFEGEGGSDRVREKIGRASLLRDEVVDALVNVPVRVYIGNRDTRVGTRHAFDFAHRLAARAAGAGVRSSPHEFVMYCSVGKNGHGTPPDVFQAGADYIQEQMEEAG